MSQEGMKPLFEDLGAPASLRAFATQARADGPSQADLDRLAARLGPALGLSAAALAVSASSTALGSAPANVASAVQPALATAKSGLFAKLMASTAGKLAAVGLSIGVGAAVFAYVQPGRPPVAETQPATAPVTTPTAAEDAPAQVGPMMDAPRQLQPAAPAPVRVVKSSRRRTQAIVPAAPKPEPQLAERETPVRPSELSLMQQAQAARARPDEALSLLSTHQQLYPRGALAQEREVLAIELLLKAGKAGEAAGRVQQFETSYPGSAHLPRLRALLSRSAAK